MMMKIMNSIWSSAVALVLAFIVIIGVAAMVVVVVFVAVKTLQYMGVL